MNTLLKSKGFGTHRPGRVAVWMAVLAAAALLPGSAAAQAPADIGLVMSVSGEVRYENPADLDGPERVQAFMKVRKGDRIRLPDKGRIDLLFLEKGRREVWTGPAHLTLTADGAEAGEEGVVPQVTPIQVPVTMAIEGGGLPLPRGRIARGGMTVVRGLFDDCSRVAPAPRPVTPLSPADRAALAEARKSYQDMRRASHAVDPLPDLYYLSVLARYDRFGEMEKIVDRLRRIHGDLPALEKWTAWIRDNYPIRLSFFLLKPDSGCRRGRACLSLGELGRFRKHGPCPASELDEKHIQPGDILTFAITNTSDEPLYCAIVNIDGAGKIERLFPDPAGHPAEDPTESSAEDSTDDSTDDSADARLAPGGVLDLFSDAGIGLMPENKGVEMIRVYLSPSPLSTADLARIEEGTADHITAIDALMRVSKRSP